MSCCPHTLDCLLRLADLDMWVAVSTAVALEAGILCTELQVVAYCYFAIRSKVRDTSAMCVLHCELLSASDLTRAATCKSVQNSIFLHAKLREMTKISPSCKHRPVSLQDEEYSWAAVSAKSTNTNT